MKQYDLDTYLLPVWSGNKVYYESATFVGEEGEVTLLHEPTGGVEVYDSMLQKTYVEGVDYIVRGRKLRRIKGGILPFFAMEEYYLPEKCVHPILATKGVCSEYNEARPFLVFGEADTMTKRQIAVTYTHKEAWKGTVPADKSGRFPRLLKKLQTGESVKITFYGDSITTGCNSSGMPQGGNVPPYADCFPVMVKKHLEKQYGVNVDYVNTAVGGWTTAQGLENFSERVLDRNVDLLVLGFGMNDIWGKPQEYAERMEKMIELFFEKNPDGELLLLSSMFPNVETNWATETTSMREFEKILLTFEEKYPSVSVADITQMQADLLASGKRYRDTTGNNVNHPNDFLARIYAQVILKTLIGKNV